MRPFSFRRGLTLVEVLITAAILSGGLVAIYRAFFLSADYIDRLGSRIQALMMIEERIAVIEKDFRDLKDLDVGALVEVVPVNNRSVEYHYAIDLKPVGTLLSVFQLDIDLSWRMNGRTERVSRSAFFSGISSLGAGI
ncbi:MAG: type II secretion system protein [Elusimicrobia bacterium]|nr:type II secretion system protein [Elusimicrobiota bacterium]